MTSHEFKAWRESHGFTQIQAANELGFSASAIADYERGQSDEPSISKAIEQACEAFDQNRIILRLKIKEKIREKIKSGGPPGSITPEILQEILLGIVDAI
jgi:transcriptional regulator with XRE-family HTH domain